MHTAELWDHLGRMRAATPLVVNITNNVVTGYTANVLLALGASPAMSHAVEEMDELPALAGALVLNIGTPAKLYVEAMYAATATAYKAHVPVILDPVACGATRYRAEVTRRVLDIAPVAAVRGNASEILALAGAQSAGRGVDSTDAAEAAVTGAKDLARQLGCVVCVSGEVDYVTDGSTTLAVHGGHPLMTRITGMGCAATAVCGAFLAVVDDPLQAVTTGMAVMSAAGSYAAANSRGPGSMQVAFLDALYTMHEGMLGGARVETLG